MVVDGPESEQEPGPDPLARFRSWRGFLFAAILVNGLFVWGMWGSVADPRVAAWAKSLSWLPFNVIATVLYFVFMNKLSRFGEDAGKAGGTFYVVLCLALIAANWIAMFVA